MAGISRESSARQGLLVDDLLLLAHGGRPLERKPVELDDLVREAVETARAVEPEREIALTTEPAEVVGDAHRLREVVDNLLANARSHTPAGTAVSVTVATNDGHAVIEVADAGQGISAEDAERVFERFYRADTSRARARGGVGLGLPIVAAVADAAARRRSSHAPARVRDVRIELRSPTRERGSVQKCQPPSCGDPSRYGPSVVRGNRCVCLLARRSPCSTPAPCSSASATTG